jgi:hypothetical protein
LLISFLLPGRVLASPLARKTAREKNVDLSSIAGTGPNDRIIQADVLEFVAAGGGTSRYFPHTMTWHSFFNFIFLLLFSDTISARQVASATTAAPATARPTARVAELEIEAGSVTEIPHSNIRRITAQRLVEAKQTIPHFYLTIEIRVDELLKLRSHLNEKSETKLSVNDFIIKAASCALREVCTMDWKYSWGKFNFFSQTFFFKKYILLILVGWFVCVCDVCVFRYLRSIAPSETIQSLCKFLFFFPFESCYLFNLSNFLHISCFLLPKFAVIRMYI